MNLLLRLNEDPDSCLRRFPIVGGLGNDPGHTVLMADDVTGVTGLWIGPCPDLVIEQVRQ
jgi:hypothetical protein